MLNKSEINKILVISLTNIGDVVLTFPVIDILREDFPSVKLSVVIGPKAESLLCNNPHLEKVYIFNKHQSPLKTLSWVLGLRREHFDLVVDLRNTAIPIMISPRYRTSCRVEKVSDLHMRKKHINHLRSIYETEKECGEQRALFISENEINYVRGLIENEIGLDQKYAIVAPGAADFTKRWPEENFAYICDQLNEKDHIKTVFVGGEDDRKVAQRINKLMEGEGVNLCGRTNLPQLAQLLKHCLFALVNDSAPMHLASYLNVSVLALFGPSNPKKYGPWSANSQMIKKDVDCPSCLGRANSSGHKCMKAISNEDVLNALKNFIEQPHG